MSIPFSTLPAILIFLLPGLAWWVWTDEGRIGTYDFTSRLTDAIGLSLALPAIIGLGTFFFGWRFSGLAIGWIYGLAGLLAVIPLFKRKTSLSARSIPHLHSFDWRNTAAQDKSPISNTQLLITNYLPLILFVLLLAFRFYQSRDLALPPWVDSVHHTLLVRLFLETGGVPPTLQPYMDIPFYYHYGFHLNTALFAFFARLSPDQAVLIFGQFLNAFVSLAMYRLGMALWNDPRRAMIALILTGFVFQMPGYYLTWGRYTLLTGLALMILGMAAALDIIRASKDRTCAAREASARLVIYVAGVLLTHYFAAGLLALFFIVLVVEKFVFGDMRFWKIWKQADFQTIFLSGLIGFLLAAPWLWQVWAAGNRYFGVNVVAPTESPDTVYFSGYLEHLWSLLGPYRSHVMLFVGLAALLAVGWRDRTRPFGLWTVAFVILSLPWGVHIAPFRPDYGVIVFFFPAAMLIADAFITPLDAAAPWFRWFARGALTAALISLLVWGVREMRDVVNPVTILATQAEVHALGWIEQNTPEDANFFINVTYWQSGSYRGVDGGWWIMPLTGRRTFLPPALYVLDNQVNTIAINALGERAAQFKDCSVEFQAFLKENSLTHIYLGPNQGSLRPEMVENCPGLNIVYQQEGVVIYEVPHN